MRFFDHVCFLCDATEDKEGNLHSEANGRFVSKTEGAKQSAQSAISVTVKRAENKNLSTLQRTRPLSSYIDDLNTSDPREVIENFVRTELQGGYIPCNLREAGPQKVFVTRSIAGEARSLINAAKNFPSHQKEVAQRILIALDESVKTLQEGRSSKWVGNYHQEVTKSGKTKHEGDSFMYFVRRTKDRKGRPFSIVATVRKPKSADFQKYALNVQGSKSFKKKWKSIEKDFPPLELVSIRPL